MSDFDDEFGSGDEVFAQVDWEQQERVALQSRQRQPQNHNERQAQNDVQSGVLGGRGGYAIEEDPITVLSGDNFDDDDDDEISGPHQIIPQKRPAPAIPPGAAHAFFTNNTARRIGAGAGGAPKAGPSSAHHPATRPGASTSHSAARQAPTFAAPSKAAGGAAIQVIDDDDDDDFDDDYDESFFQQVAEVEAQATASAVAGPSRLGMGACAPRAGNVPRALGYTRPIGGGAGARQSTLLGNNTSTSTTTPQRAAPRRATGLLSLSANRAHSSATVAGVQRAGAQGGSPQRPNVGEAAEAGQLQMQMQSNGAIGLTGGSAPRTTSSGSNTSGKRWNRTQRAASGGAVMHGKGKGRQMDEEEEEGWDEDENGPREDWDARFANHRLAHFGAGVNGSASTDARANGTLRPGAEPTAPGAMKLKIDEEAARTWVYPTNFEERDYQFNIVSKALFNNVLVALPTGLGKTFIAAVVMLNFYRWYPKGKIIFVAPTRPLVAQQQHACHGICGLPWQVAIELTGETKSSDRALDWQEKRIFYMTPQTLVNDIERGNCDPRDVVCLVIDEAHRGTGRYAYTTIVQQLMAVNPHFRVLALSATPGKNAEVVQDIVDNLHISAIEIRTEDAIDIMRYVHRKNEVMIKVSRDPQIEAIKELWAKLMEDKFLKELRKFQLLRENQRAEYIKPFTLRAMTQDRSKVDFFRTKKYLLGYIASAQPLAAAMEFLLDSSVKLFRDRVLEVCKSTNGIKETTAEVQDILNQVGELKKGAGYHHPKLEALREVLVEHFNQDEISAMQDADAAEATGGDATHRRTRAMVFCSSREVVDEIVNNLNAINMDACRFVGQGSDRNGSKGMMQKEQKQAVKDFKDGKHRILVATSIGEEGLDIGEIDLIVCYDAIGDPVRMLQRVGRTGRKRDGNIVLLVTEGRDDNKWQSAKDKHSLVLKSITNGHYELYDDVERMVPPHIVPTVEKKKVPVLEFDPSLISRGRNMRGPAKAKAKKVKDPKRGMPADGPRGFTKASKLGSKSGVLSSDTSDSDTPIKDRAPLRPSVGTGKALARLAEDSELDSDDSNDELLNTSLSQIVRNVTTHGSALPSKKSTLSGRSKLNISSDAGPRMPSLSKSSGLAKPMEIDSDESDVVAIDAPSNPPRRSLGSNPARRQIGTPSSGASRNADSNAASAAPYTFGPSRPPEIARFAGAFVRPSLAATGPEEPYRGKTHPLLAQFLANETGGKGNKARAPSRAQSSNEPAAEGSTSAAGAPKRAAETTSKPAKRRRADKKGRALKVVDQNISRAAQIDSDDDCLAATLPPHFSSSQEPLASSLARERALRGGPASDESDAMPLAARIKTGRQQSPDSDQSDEPLQKMVPAPRVPLVPATSSSVPPAKNAAISTPSSGPQARAAVRQAADHSPAPKPFASDDEEDDSPLLVRRRATSAARMAQQPDSSPVPQKTTTPPRQLAGHKRKSKKGKRRIGNSPRSRAFFQYAADRSTDEEVHGELDEDDSGHDSAPDSDDREHVGEFQSTQAPKGYNQRGIYLQSLMTQGGPSPFKNGNPLGGPFPGVGGRFGVQGGALTGPNLSRARRPVLLSDDAVAAIEEDRYSMDSFVCDDDEVEFEDGYNAALGDNSEM